MKKTEPRFTVDTEGRVSDHEEINERKRTEEQFQARLRLAQANAEKAIEKSMQQTRTKAEKQLNFKSGKMAFKLGSLVLLLGYICWRASDGFDLLGKSALVILVVRHGEIDECSLKR